jgi:hypothetical protein
MSGRRAAGVRLAGGRASGVRRLGWGVARLLIRLDRGRRGERGGGGDGEQDGFLHASSPGAS